MTEDDVNVGDVFRIGNAVAQITQPRNPCYKLGIKMESPEFVRTFLESGLLGLYFRVLGEGEIGAGDNIERIQTDPIGISVREMARLRNFDRDNLERAEQALQIDALAPEIKGEFEHRLKKAEASG